VSGATRANSTSPAAAPSPEQSIAYTHVVDLSHRITQTIPLWPGDSHVEFDVVATWEKNGYHLRKVTIGEHSATHMNAPNASSPVTRRPSRAIPRSNAWSQPS
jgi:hypothetical protein